MPVTRCSIPYLLSHRAARLPREDDLALPGAELLVVGDHVAGDEPAKRIENRLGKRDRVLDGRGLTEHVEHHAVVGRGQARHRAENTTDVVWPERAGPRMIGA